MKKPSTIVLVLFGIFLSFSIQAQTKPTLTILPFTGATGGDEEAVTSLLSRHEDLHKIFTIVPCTTNFNALAKDIEAEIYTTEADLVADVKSRLNADFAVLVWAEKVGKSNLTLLSLVHVGTLRQVAGDYRKYNGIRDIRTALPDITKKIIDAAQIQPSDLPHFSVFPFYYSGENTTKDAAILFQLLNIELANSKKYALFPWALIVDSLINGRNIPYYYGIVDPEGINTFGLDSKIQYVLTGDLLNQGLSKLFMASVISTDDGDFLIGGDIEYRTITDDFDLVIDLSKRLIGGDNSLAAVTPGVDNPPERTPVINNFPAPPQLDEKNESPVLVQQGQTKPTLTLLPFSGQTGGDEETITILLANQGELRNTFNVIPCTTNFSRLLRDIESKNYSNREDITAELQKHLNVDFALIVRAEKVGTNNVVLISLVQMETLQQLSGSFQKYSVVRDIRELLPDIAKEMIIAMQLTPAGDVPKLTVLPFYTPSGVDVRDADILFQYLTIELTNSGKYTVYPWALPIETLVTDLKMPYFGIIDPKSLNAFEANTGIPYVLTGDLLNLGTTNLFMTSIVKTNDAGVLNDGDIEYRVIMENMSLLSALAKVIIYGSDAVDPWAVAESESSPEAIVMPPPSSPRLPAHPFEKFVKIPAGTFTMGTPLTEVSRDSDEIQHRVQVAGFYLAKHEVSQEEYEAVMGTNPSYFPRANLPVEQVNWYEAIAYCNARSIKEGLTPAYTINGEQVTWNRNADGYRLPTEEEWEYACRAGTVTTFNTGNTITSSDGNFDGTYSYNQNPTGLYRERTTPVGTFNPNAWGLYDMHGNVYEWCWDWYAPYNTGNPNSYPLTKRIARGGSWYSAPRYLRAGNRVQFSADAHVYYVGFRVARNLPN